MGSEKAREIDLWRDPRTPLYGDRGERDSYSKVWRTQYPKMCMPNSLGLTLPSNTHMIRSNHIWAAPDVYVAVSKFKICIPGLTSASDAAAYFPPPTCVLATATHTIRSASR